MRPETKRIVVAAIAAFALLFAAPDHAAPAITGTGMDLKTICESAQQDPDFIGCLGFIAGFMRHAELLINSGQKYFPCFSPPVFATEQSITLEQIRLIYLKWTREHPENLHVHSGAALALALSSAYPCSE